MKSGVMDLDSSARKYKPSLRISSRRVGTAHLFFGELKWVGRTQMGRESLTGTICKTRKGRYQTPTPRPPTFFISANPPFIRLRRAKPSRGKCSSPASKYAWQYPLRANPFAANILRDPKIFRFFA